MSLATSRSPRNRRGRARTGERGQASIEVVALAPLFLILCLGLWQLLLVGWSAIEAENAARNVSRSAVEGKEADRVARRSLSPGLRDGASTEVVGEEATVRLRIPIVVPGLDAEGLALTRSATLPGR